MRIIAGAFKGRKLFTPATDAIRPTSDRTRESLFNLLMHGAFGGEAIIGQHVVDLCCGTGALGLEALSRGAAKVTFIDKNKQALELTRQNITHCGANQQAQVVAADATRLPIAREPAALVIYDAPYDSPIFAASHASLVAGGWVQQNTLIVCEQATHTAAQPLPNTELVDERKYGKTKLLIYRVE